jgi:hypothetical protein
MTDDTPNSVLTAGQRKFLQKSEEERDEDYSRQGRSHHRRQIRKRTRQAFRDFSLLYDTLDENERKKIFNVAENPVFDRAAGKNVGLSRETRDGITDTLAFLYLSLTGEVGEDFSRLKQPGVPDFESALEGGVSQAEHDRRPDHNGSGPFVSTELTVDVDTEVDVAAAAEKLARGDVWRLSEAELRALAQTANGNVDSLALEPLIDEKRKALGMDPEEIRRDIHEWFEDTYIHDVVDESGSDTA